MPHRWAYLGPEGTFTEQAVRLLDPDGQVTAVPVRSVPEALDMVRESVTEAAVVPVENSVGGAVGVTLDELAVGTPLMIAREVALPVTFVLATLPGTSTEQITTIAAHPQAAAQCRGWLRDHLPDASVIEVLSNAAAAAGVAGGEFRAAVCAPVGAQRHRLTVVCDAIADHSDAMTRFVMVTRPGPPPPPTDNDVTSLAVYIAHDRVGALLAVLTELAVRGVNLTRIESRPTGERLGRYAFFLDCTGHVAQARMGEALQGLRRVCAAVRFLGSYPRWTGTAEAGVARPESPVSAPPGTTDTDFVESGAWLARLRTGEASVDPDS